MTAIRPQALGTIYAEPPITRIASEAITMGHGVKDTSTENTVDLNDTAGEKSAGVALNDAAAGEPVAVLRSGHFDKAVAGAALATIGVPLMVNSSGRYVAATTGGTKRVVGYNRTTASGDGDQFVLELVKDGELLA